MLDNVMKVASIALLLSIISLVPSLYIVIKPLTEPIPTESRADFHIPVEPSISPRYTEFWVRNNGTANATNVWVETEFRNSTGSKIYKDSTYIPEITCPTNLGTSEAEVDVPVGYELLNQWGSNEQGNYTLRILVNTSVPGVGWVGRIFTYETSFPTT
jgi:hypothetical protein